MKITGVILAAGTSSRMGTANKLLLKYQQHTVIEEVLEQVVGSKVDEVIVVTGFENRRLERLLARYLSPRITIVHNRDYERGRAESIKCAIRHVGADVDAALFMVGDKPTVSRGLIDRAIDCFRRKRPHILYVEVPSGRGHPIIFSRALFDELLLLEGDRIGDDLLAQHRHHTATLYDASPQTDIDCEQDYAALLASAADKT